MAMHVVAGLIAICVFVQWAPKSAAAESEAVNILVVAIRGVDAARHEWSPTIEYLQRSLPQYRFSLLPVIPKELERIRGLVREGGVDFLITQPAIYVDLELSNGISRILTMVKKGDISEFGSTIVTLASSDIHTVEDLNGKTLAGVARLGFGGWLIGYEELLKNDFDPYRDAKDVKFLGTQPKEIEALIKKEVDVVVVRTGMLESLAAKGKVDLSDFRILLQKNHVGFPFAASTALYPEWAFSRTKKVSFDLAKAVTQTLLQMPKNSLPAARAGYQEWISPFDYQPVHELMKNLRVGPYQDYGKITLSGFVDQYWAWLLAIAGAFSATLAALAYSARLSGMRKNAERAVRDLNQVLEKRIEDRTRELVGTEQRAQSIIDTAVEVIITIDPRGVIKSANRAIEKILGYAPEEVVGQNVSVLMPSPYRESHDGYLEAYQTTGKAGIIGIGREVPAIRKDGTEIQAYLAVSEVRSSDSHYFVGLLTDITELKKKEAELAKSNAEGQAKSEFLAMMSHEIRTPMTSIMGFADALMDEDLATASKDKVRRIKDSTQALLKIINEVLEITKLEAGKMEIASLDFHLHTMLSDVISMFDGDGQGDLEVCLSLGNDLPEAVHGDLTRIRQVLINLVGNAVKFTKAGRVSLSVERRSESDRGDTLYFSVRDTGIGISAEVLPKLFTDFTQADSSISRDFEGTGLGLSICKRLVELMGGEIGVESQLGEGSTFWFTLPYVAAKSEVSDCAAERDVTSIEIQTLRPLHILVAEDNKTNQMIIAQTLERFGHSFEMVNDGDEAVNTLESKDFDLVLMDVRMPKVSGPDATRLVRCMDGDKARVPIIAVTADAMLEHQKGYFDAGMNGVSTKPIDRLDLARTINEVLGDAVHAFVERINADGEPDNRPSSRDETASTNEAVADFLEFLDSK